MWPWPRSSSRTKVDDHSTWSYGLLLDFCIVMIFSTEPFCIVYICMMMWDLYVLACTLVLYLDLHVWMYIHGVMFYLKCSVMASSLITVDGCIPFHGYLYILPYCSDTYLMALAGSSQLACVDSYIREMIELKMKVLYI